MSEQPGPTARRTTDDGGGSASGRNSSRRRRRFLLIYGAVAAVALVLVATMTVPGPQRVVTLVVLGVAIVGFVCVVRWIWRSPQPVDADERTSAGVSVAGSLVMIIVSNLLQSIGPDDGGLTSFAAIVVTTAMLVLPMMMTIDVVMRRRRARKNAGEVGDQVSERPNPRP